MTENGIDYQVGSHSVDTNGIDLGDGGEMFKFDLEIEPVFKRLADEIYASPSAGVREPLINGITAISEAVEKGMIDEERGVLEISLRKGEDSGELIIDDNGIGITEERLKNVLSVIGRSTSRDKDKVAGKFGMGFLAIYKLVGTTEGGFIMHTRSRKTGEYISGVWKTGGFAKVDGGIDHHKLPEDRYGTRFVIPLREVIGQNKVRDWVEKFSQYARYPVVYREYGQDGNEIFNEDYGKTKLEDINDFDSEYQYITYDCEYFKALKVNKSLFNGIAEKETILLDVPIKTQRRSISMNSYALSIRLKYENSIIVDGPNEGLRLVSEGEYNSMSPERKQKYIPEKDVKDDDIVMPGPTGTRDFLEKSEDFWEYVDEKLEEEKSKLAYKLLKDISSIEDFRKLNEEEFSFISIEILENKFGDKDSITSLLPDSVTKSVNEEIKKILSLINFNVHIVPRNKNPEKKSNYQYSKIIKILNKTNFGEEGDVYVGSSINSWKTKAVHMENENNIVLHVNKEHYEVYKNLFGWKLLKKVTKKRIRNELELNKEQKKEILNLKEKSGTKNKTVESSNVILHSGDGKQKRHKLKDLKEGLIELENGKNAEEVWDSYKKIPGEGLVVTVRSNETNLSDVEWLNSIDYPTVSLTKSQWEYIKDVERAYYASEVISEVEENVKINTSDGELTIKEAKESGSLVVHILSEEKYPYFATNESMKQMKNLIENGNIPWSKTRSSDFEEFVENTDKPVIYCPYKRNEIKKIYPGLKDVSLLKKSKFVGSSVTLNEANNVKIKNGDVIYPYIKLSDWWGTETIKILEKKLFNKRSFKIKNKESEKLLSMLINFHDSNMKPKISELPKV